METNVKTSKGSQKSFEERFNELLVRLHDVEEQLSKKADDIVTVQILQHRNEIEQAEAKLKELEQKIETLAEASSVERASMDSYEKPKERKPRFFRRVASIFTL